MSVDLVKVGTKVLESTVKGLNKAGDFLTDTTVSSTVGGALILGGVKCLAAVVAVGLEYKLSEKLDERRAKKQLQTVQEGIVRPLDNEA